MLTYSNVTALVQQAEALETLAIKDGLTELYNRRHFLHLAEVEWDRFKRYERQLSFLMLDIDHFKSINDRFGHDFGDKVLIAVAGVCRDGKRNSDIVARLGGEEFAILLPETDLDSAFVMAERLRMNISQLRIEAGNTLLSVTASIGVADAGSCVCDVVELMKRADTALYAAKRGGRNRCATMSQQQSLGFIASQIVNKRAA
jgi:diguanylate cyclase (GGDEF)-like protein